MSKIFDFNRDRGWDVLKKAGFDSVRMVAIDKAVGQSWSHHLFLNRHPGGRFR